MLLSLTAEDCKGKGGLFQGRRWQAHGLQRGIFTGRARAREGKQRRGQICFSSFLPPTKEYIEE
jgi:hypothetical protein